jgi:glycosidase
MTAPEHVAAGEETLDWVRDAVFYQIFPERFCNGDPTNDPAGIEPWEAPPTRENFSGGDLAGIRSKLPYLAELGVTALYLTPIFTAGTNHRYDTHDYLEIDPALGDGETLRSLVADAHRRGIRVVLDGVFNHCGDGFHAFRDLTERGADSPYRDWFFADRFPLRQQPPNYQTCGGAAYLPKLNTRNPELRRYLLDVGRHWIEYAEIDGWRLDVPWKVPIEFWQQFREVVKQARPDAYLVGEIWNAWENWLDVFDGLMNYRLRKFLLEFSLYDALDAEDLAHETLAYLADAPGGGLMLNLLGSHDTPRLLTLAGGDEQRAILALTALFTYPGTPMLYYGDEVGMEGGDDPDCRRPMTWNDAEWRPAIHDAVRSLIKLRRAHPALRRGSWEPLLTFNRVLAFRRGHGEDDVVVVLNGGGLVTDLSVPAPFPAPPATDALTGRTFGIEGGAIVIERLEPHAALVLTRDHDA